MRIYLDFDDVLCETARRLSALAREMFGRDVPYPRIAAFDLHAAFDLDEPQYHALMSRAHSDQELAALRAAPRMAAIVRRIAARGHDLVVVTGRPPHTNAVSRDWLRRHGLGALPMHHVDKYGREPAADGVPPEARAWTLDEFNRERFDIAVDDAPAMLDVLAGRADCLTIVHERPWNKHWNPPEYAASRVVRCRGWREIGEAIEDAEKRRAAFSASRGAGRGDRRRL